MNIVAKFLVPFCAVGLLGVSACGKKPAPQPTAETTKPAEADTAKAPEADTAKAPEADTAKAPAADAGAAPAADAGAAPAADAGAAPAGDAGAAAGDAGAAAGDAGAAPAGDAGMVAPVDYVRAVINHHDTAKGLVTVDFKTFKIVEANTDLTKLDTAKVVLEVELGSLETGIPKRNDHLKSPDFFDVAKFATFKVTVDRLKPVKDVPDTFDATATIDLHGVTKEIPVQFKVVEKKDGGVLVVEGETKGLARADWQVGGEPEKVNAAPTFDAQLRLTVAPVVPAPKQP